MTSFRFERNRSRFRSGQPAFLCARIHRLKNEKPYISLIHKVFTRFTSSFKEALSGKRDSNPRPSAWEADALPLSYSRIACRFSMEKLRKQDKSNKKTANLQLVSHFYGASPEKKIGIDRMVLSCCTVPAGRIRLSTHNFCTMSRSVGTGREKTGCCDGTVRCRKIFAGRLFLFWERSRRRIVCGRLRR